MVADYDILITADSTCDLPADIVAERGIEIVPLSILLGDEEHLDGVDVMPDDIYNYVAEHSILPKTAAVSPNRYYEIFDRAVSEGKKIVHISLSSAISSTYQNACIAAEDFDDVYVVDSKSLCTAMGLLVLKACDFRDKGMDAKKIADKVAKLVPKVSATFVINSLEYLHKGGRCSGVARFGANVLGIKPGIEVNSDGAMVVAKKYRGKMDAVYKQYVNDRLDENRIDTSRIVIADSGDIEPQTMAFIKGLVEGNGRFAEVIYADAGCTISSHCGPGTLAVFYIRR